MARNHTVKSKGAVFALATLGLVACGPAVEPPATDYSIKYPVGVRVETVALTLPFGPAGAPLSGNDELRFANLLAGYIDRGHGPITIVAPTEPAELRERLIASGVPTNAIRTVVSETGSRDTATLRYERYMAILPQCGDWGGSTGRNPTNDVHSNFGCAVQNNMGVMLADPADLVRMRDAAPTDPQNANRVVQRFRAGEPPAAVPTPLQERGAAGTTVAK